MAEEQGGLEAEQLLRALDRGLRERKMRQRASSTKGLYLDSEV